MSLVSFLIKHQFSHFIINRLFGNRVRRGQNKLQGRFIPLMRRTTIRMYGKDNLISLGSGMLSQCLLHIEGSGNRIVIGSEMKLLDTSIFIKADNSRIEIGAATKMNNAEIGIDENDSAIEFDDDVKLGGYVWLKDRANRTDMVRVYAGGGRKVILGKGAAIAEGTRIRNTDSHNIYLQGDPRRDPLNAARDVVIGEHCWVCAGAVLLKGAVVGSGCVVGGQALVTGDLSNHPNAVIAGSPAKAIKENIEWEL